MNGFGIFMLIFGVLIILAGFYVYRGHNNELLLWKGYSKHRTKEELKIIGKWTMIVGLIPIAFSIASLFFKGLN